MSEEQSRAAEALALAAASRAQADAFLAEQTELTRLTIERETRDEKLRGWSQMVEHISGLMKLVFDSAVALVVIVIVIAITAALWNAGHSNGLVIEAFSRPARSREQGPHRQKSSPARCSTRLSALKAATQSNWRAQSSYANNWGNDIKVQIPDTGVSIGQLYQYLVRWLGNEQHISGDIYRDGNTLAVTSRIGGDSSETLHGSEDKLDDLITSAAESVYRRTQPYRYAVYLDNQRRPKEAQAIYRALIAGNNLDDRAWAYVGLSSERSGVGDMAGAAVLLGRVPSRSGRAFCFPTRISRTTRAIFSTTRPSSPGCGARWRFSKRGADPSMNPEDFTLNVISNKATLAGTLGDFQAQLRYNRQVEALPLGNGNAGNAGTLRNQELQTCAALHDRGCYDAVYATPPPGSTATCAS